MKSKTLALLILAALAVILFPACGSLPPLPPGSYAEAGAGYSKDTGPDAHVTVHVTLDRAPAPAAK